MDCPYSDKYMVYNENIHKYVLTKDAVYTFTGINLVDKLGSDNETDIFLLEQTNIIYNGLIYKYSALGMRRVKEYLLAKDGDLREIIQEALLEQVKYSIRSGGDLMYYQHGVNIEKGMNIDINVLRGSVHFSPMAKDLLAQESYILYRGIIPFKSGDDWYRNGY